MKKMFLIFLVLIPIVFSKIYMPNENITIYVELSDYRGNPIENANCTAKIYSPNLDLVYNLSLEYNDEIGCYYSSFLAPSDYGTYLEVVNCSFEIFGRTQSLVSRNTFVVTSGFDFVNKLVQNASLNISLNITGNITQALEEGFSNINSSMYAQYEDLIGLLLALHSTPNTSKKCISKNLLEIEKIAYWNVNGRIIPIRKYEYVVCRCENDDCVVGESFNPLFLLVILVPLIFIIYKFKK